MGLTAESSGLGGQFVDQPEPVDVDFRHRGTTSVLLQHPLYCTPTQLRLLPYPSLAWSEPPCYLSLPLHGLSPPVTFPFPCMVSAPRVVFGVFPHVAMVTERGEGVVACGWQHSWFESGARGRQVCA